MTTNVGGMIPRKFQNHNADYITYRILHACSFITEFIKLVRKKGKMRGFAKQTNFDRQNSPS